MPTSQSALMVDYPVQFKFSFIIIYLFSQIQGFLEREINPSIIFGLMYSIGFKSLQKDD